LLGWDAGAVITDGDGDGDEVVVVGEAGVDMALTQCQFNS
jgi:hypothetical protein